MMLVVVQPCVYTVRPVLRTAWLTCALSDTHTRSHGRGVQECLVWLIAGEHDGSRWAHPLDTAKWVAAGWGEGNMPTRGKGSKLSSDPTPTTAHQPPTHSIADNGEAALVARAALKPYLGDFLLSFNVNSPAPPCVYTVKLRAMDRVTIRIL